MACSDKLANSGFQSTRPRGARPHALDYSSYHPIVSIHAPAWGATSSRRTTPWTCDCFNPRARVGRDEATDISTVLSAKFQSTRPRGARPEVIRLTAYVKSEFQSTRPRGARRPECRFRSVRSIVSIHAPAWGATVYTISPDFSRGKALFPLITSKCA